MLKIGTTCISSESSPMRRRSRVSLLTAAMLALALLPLCAHPQGSGKDGKQDGGKAPLKDSKGGESKMPAQDKSNGPPAKPMPPTLDKLKTPADAIIILVDKLQEATELIPKAVILAPEKYQELQDRIRALEQQLKGGKSIPNSCKLTGKLEGDYVALRAEFNFATQRPRTPVLLGLQGAHLVEEGDIDKTVPQLDYGDEGFFVRVDREGSHQLTLNLKVPVGWKRGGGPVGAPERAFELGLPGAPAITLSLDMPPAIKEMRMNEGLKKNKTAGQWEMSLGMAKQVTVAWREPQAPSGGGPLLAMDAQIVVKLEEPVPQLHAELVLEDLRGQNKSWRLRLPPGAMAALKTPALPAGAYQWLKPDAKNPWHVLELKDATTERITVSVQAEAASAPAGEGKLPVGPFALADAFRLQGTVLVQATAAGLRGRRLIYHRSGEVAQRELPANSRKADAGFENLAYFQYATASASGNAAARPPLEIEFKSAAGLAETQTDHNLRLRGEGTTWLVESTTRIQAKSLVEATDYVDVQLPRRRAGGGLLELASVAPALAFPALMPWPGLAPADARLSWAAPVEIRWEEEGTEMPAADGTRRVRLRWSRQNPKQTTLTLHGKYAVPPGARQVRLDLPRPLGVLDRGGSVNVACGPLVELLAPGLDGPEAVPDRQYWQRQADLAPTTVDVAWRPYQPASPVSAVVDITIFERSAQVRQHLYFMTPDKSAGSLRLRAPPPIEQVTVESGGKILGDAKPKNELLWVAPTADASGKCDLLLEYDVPLPPPAPADEAAAPAVWNLPLIWPDAAAFGRRDAKVRVWLPPGTFSALAPGADDWHERGIESVPERDGLPGLVVRGAGGHLPLMAPVRLSQQAPLASLVCDRVLIHARVEDDGTHFYRARFLVRKVAGRKLTLEL